MWNIGSSASGRESWSGWVDFARPSGGLLRCFRLSRSVSPPSCNSFPILRRSRWRGDWASRTWHGRMPPDFADALYSAGDLGGALEAADEAITVARRRTDRIAELHATLLRGLALAADGDAQNDEEVGELIKHAEGLLDVSGAAFFEPRLVQLRSHLERRG